MDSSGSLLRDNTATAPSNTGTLSPTSTTTGMAGASAGPTTGTGLGSMVAMTGAAGSGSATSAAAAPATTPTTQGSTAMAAGAGASAAAAGAAAMEAAPAMGETMAAAGAMAAGAAGAGESAASNGPSMGMVTFTFTTKSYGGFYAPRNYGAVWFETKGGEFVKTSECWAGLAHATDLVVWTAASGGWGSIFGGGGNTADKMDAVSSATLRDHETHTIMWNMKDVDKNLVPDGDYVALVELTEDRKQAPGPVLRVPFTKGPAPQMVEPPDEKAFTGISLTYQP